MSNLPRLALTVISHTEIAETNKPSRSSSIEIATCAFSDSWLGLCSNHSQTWVSSKIIRLVLPRDRTLVRQSQQRS